MNTIVEQKKQELRELIAEAKASIYDYQQELKLLDQTYTCNHQWVLDREFLIDYPKADAYYCKKCNMDRWDYNHPNG